MTVEKVKAEPVEDHEPKPRTTRGRPGIKHGRKPKTPARRRPMQGLLIGDLTPPQEAYSRARAMGMDALEALAAIGSPVTLRTVQAWERTTPVGARIAELSDIATRSAVEKTGLSREWVMSRLMAVVDRCMQAEPVLDKKGKETGAYVFDAQGANQALKMLGDTMGLYKPAAEKPGDEYREMSDEDLQRLATELAKQTGLMLEG